MVIVSATAVVDGSWGEASLRYVQIAIHELPWVGLQDGRWSANEWRPRSVGKWCQLAVVEHLIAAVLSSGLELLLNFLDQVL